MSGFGYGSLKNALCLTNLKSAALYFDRVIPINPLELIRYDFPPLTKMYTGDDYWKDLDRVVKQAFYDNDELIKELVFKGVDVSDEFKRNALDDIVLNTDLLYQPLKIAYPRAFYNAHYVLPDYHQFQQEMASNLILDGSLLGNEISASNLMVNLSDRLGIKSPSLLLAVSPSHENKETNGAIEVVLSQLKMIDTSCVSFEQILQLRGDADSQNRLKRLRLFIHENFSELDPEIATDKFDQTVYDYHEACRKHGLNTIDSTLTGILSFETYMVSTIGLMSGAVALGSTVASLAMGLSFAVGGAALNIVKSNRVSRSYAKNHAVSYIFHDLNKLHK